jgi:hypothetical protein
MSRAGANTRTESGAKFPHRVLEVIQKQMSFLPLIRIWIWVSVLASVAGWLLSALGQLNRVGYAVFGAVAVVCLWVGRKALGLAPAERVFSWRKARSRFRRWLPAGFAGLALLILIGSVGYPPTTHEALSCRVPRVLHWLAAGQWHWIHTPVERMNNRPCGQEWLLAPLLLFTHSDRALFLINYFPLLLMPGLIFSVCTRLGVRPRVAGHWMWLLPTGYNFLLQGGSLGDDTMPAIYALAAVDFGLRAWSSRRPADLWLASLSAALLVGAKASNLPLLLPWAVVVLPLLPLLLGRPASGFPFSRAQASLPAGAATRQLGPSAAMLPATAKPGGQAHRHSGLAACAATFLLVLLCATVSFLPTAILNARYCGDWTGLKLEHAGTEIKHPLIGVWGNSLLLLKNLAPPFFPAARWWNQSALTLLPHVVMDPLVANFEKGFYTLGELPIEDVAGIGFGVSWLLLISVVAAWCVGARKRAPQVANRDIPRSLRLLVLAAPWISLLVYFSKMAMMDLPRHISSYYALLLPALLLGPGQAWVVRQRWWRGLAWGVMALAALVVVLTPARPLWPARTVLSKLAARKPNQRLLQRALEVYTVFGNRSDPLANVRALLPPGLKVVGFMGTVDDLDISFWRPYGSRRVKHILLSDSPEQIRQRHIQYAVVGEVNLAEHHTTLADWQERTGAKLLATAVATVTVSQGPCHWYVVRFPW